MAAAIRRTALALLAALVPLTAWAQTPPAADLGQLLRDADRNRDGRLDREEYHRVIVEAFFFLDKDKNGYLVIAEMVPIDAAAFRGADRDGDGRLSLQEYVNALFKDFDVADRDKDGVLTFDEIQVYVRATRR